MANSSYAATFANITRLLEHLRTKVTASLHKHTCLVKFVEIWEGWDLNDKFQHVSYVKSWLCVVSRPGGSNR